MRCKPSHRGVDGRFGTGRGAALCLVAAALLGWPRAAAADPSALAASELVGSAARAALRASHDAPSARPALRRGKARRKAARRSRRRYRRVQGLVLLANGPGLRVRTPEQAWGTPLTVRRLSEVMTAYHEHFPEAAPIWVHDLSRRFGGRLRPHRSHDSGQDVDIRLVLEHETTHCERATPHTLDLEKTWFLLLRLIDTGDVQVIFLDRQLQRALFVYARDELGYTEDALASILEYPGRRSGLVRHWRGHADHLHVRFRAGAPRDDLALRWTGPATTPPT